MKKIDVGEDEIKRAVQLLAGKCVKDNKDFIRNALADEKQIIEINGKKYRHQLMFVLEEVE